MASEDFEAAEIRKFIELVQTGAAQEQFAAPITDMDSMDDLWRRPEPQLLPVPATVQGFRLRIDLQRAKPPVWRRIEVPGDITLPRLHEVIQASMGWTDSHLHRFRTGNGRNAPEFLTQFDLDDGDEGMLEIDVRLDRILSATGDRLWYDYDFGDNWEHVLRVEKVLDTPPPAAVCIAGKLACPPEDCGGIWGYDELADWVRGDYAEALRPEVFDSTADGRDWLPDGWHPDAFDIDETNQLIAMVTAEPVAVVEELASLLELSRNRGTRGLRDALAHPSAHGPTEISADAAVELTEPFRVLLDVIGGGAPLTGAGYLKPADVEQIAQRTGIADWWIGKANREDLTWPIADLRASARALGLVSVRKGRIAPTRLITDHTGDAQAILRHIINRLPLGRDPADRHAGWAALAVAGSETPVQLWDENISSLMYELGWRSGGNPYGGPPADSPTLDVLRLLAGAARKGPRAHGVNHSVAALARAVIQT
ncbi:plasmid pRiA4b ORF-3 family protein [Millisia brevis]|uniref:plasmid pRiA4b ORF-3 family protein n=1 Tax=Millisia brevis TaxID=264148 RepID=UPI000AAE590F|nr:plasmid pRiA4b ORF-3 family protein [Millisia brevis]